MPKVSVKQTLVGVVSWCDIDKFPERWSTFKRMVRSLEKYLSREEAVTAVVDNNSSQRVQQFIESASIFDVKVMLPENIHDVGGYGVLAQIAKDNGLPYIWILENDFVLYKTAAISDYISFLKSHPECGYLRLQKFSYNHRDKYAKGINRYDTDKENAVWLQNIVSGEKLTWVGPFKQNQNLYYTNNWHFGLHGGFIALKTWHKLFPPLLGKVPYYYKFEKYVREKYYEQGLKTGVLDGGVFSMSAPSVYQHRKTLPLINTLREKLTGPKGGFIEVSVVRHYQQNYTNYFPVQIQLLSNSLGTEELAAVKKVFASRWLGYGGVSQKFEQKFAATVGAKYALGITSCTSGLFMSMEMLDIGRGDEVIIPSIGFIGCANAVLKAGAKPVFADVDSQYFNLQPREVKRLISHKTRAVIVLHYGGIPADIDSIKEIISAQKRRIYLIEDSANSTFSHYKNKVCGTLGDIGLYSLESSKVITSGTGGILTTNIDKLHYRAQVVRYFGLVPGHSSGYDAMRARKDRWWEIELVHPGNRYLINDIASAIGLEQLVKLPLFINKRKQIWQYYQHHLKSIPGVTIPKEPPQHTTSSYYFYWVQVKDAAAQLSLARELVRNGIYTTFRYYPLHLIKFYKSRVHLPISEKLGETTLNLPLHQNLSTRDCERVVATIKQWVEVQSSH